MESSKFPNIPGYKITTEIARGGMAIVYLAVQETLERPVALKVLKSAWAANKNTKERFLREGRILSSLSHSNIVQVYDSGEYGDNCFLAMEYLPGGTLRDQLRQPMPLPRVLQIITGVASVLGYAHSCHYIHRDIKPHNILFREDGTPVLTDFGIAKQLDAEQDLTRSGAVLGTWRYMSPEQLDGRLDLDGRTDLYSLGVLFYQMLTGKPPYQGESLDVLYIQHTQGRIPQLPQAMAELQPILDRLLAKNPDERFASAEALIEALDAFRRAQSPPEPPPVASAPRSRRKLAAAGVMLFIAVAIAAWQLPALIDGIRRSYTIDLIGDVEAQIQETEQAIEQVESAKYRSRAQLEDLLAEKQEKLADLQRQLATLQAAQAQLAQQINTEQLRAEQLQYQYQQALAAEEQNVQRLQAALDELLARARQAEFGWKGKIATLKVQRGELEQKLQTARDTGERDKETYGDTVEREQESLQALRRELEETSARITQADPDREQEIERLRAAQEELKNQLQRVQAQAQQAPMDRSAEQEEKPIAPQTPPVEPAEDPREISRLRQQAEKQIAEGRLIEPQNNEELEQIRGWIEQTLADASARLARGEAAEPGICYLYRQVLEVDPANRAALDALDQHCGAGDACGAQQRAADEFAAQAQRLRGEDPRKALDVIRQGLAQLPQHAALLALLAELRATLGRDYTATLIDEAYGNQAKEQVFDAWALYRLALLLEPANPRIKGELPKIARYALTYYRNRLKYLILADDIYRQLLSMATPYGDLRERFEQLEKLYRQRQFSGDEQAERRLQRLRALLTKQGEVSDWGCAAPVQGAITGARPGG